MTPIELSRKWASVRETWENGQVVQGRTLCASGTGGADNFRPDFLNPGMEWRVKPEAVTPLQRAQGQVGLDCVEIANLQHQLALAIECRNAWRIKWGSCENELTAIKRERDAAIKCIEPIVKYLEAR